MSMFSRIQGGQVLLTNRGVYQEADLWRRGEELFAAVKKNGFGRLLAGNLTTVPGVRWTAIEGFHYVEQFDGPKVPPAPEAVAAPARKKLRAI